MLAEAARNEPEDPRGHLYYAALLVQFGDADSDDGADGLEDARRALPHARRAIELGRATADAHEVLAFALYAHGEFEEALASVERAQEESGPKVQLRLLRALCLSQTRRLEDARDELEDLGEELETVERIAPALRPFVNEGRGLIER